MNDPWGICVDSDLMLPKFDGYRLLSMVADINSNDAPAVCVRPLIANFVAEYAVR